MLTNVYAKKEDSNDVNGHLRQQCQVLFFIFFPFKQKKTSSLNVSCKISKCVKFQKNPWNTGLQTYLILSLIKKISDPKLAYFFFTKKCILEEMNVAHYVIYFFVKLGKRV